MLVVGRVVHPRSEQDDVGISHLGRRERPEGVQQQAAVLLDVAHPGAPEQPGHTALQRVAAGEHVAHSRRNPQVVLEDREPVVGPNEVGAAHGDVGAVRHLHPPHLDPVVLVPVHQLGRDDAVPDDVALVVDVMEEQVQRPQPLFEAAGHLVPRVAAHEAGQAVNRKDALDGLLVAIDREGDPLVEEGPGDPLLDLPEVVRRGLADGLEEIRAVGPGHAVPLEHLVVERRAVPVLAKRRTGRKLARGGGHRAAGPVTVLEAPAIAGVGVTGNGRESPGSGVGTELRLTWGARSGPRARTPRRSNRARPWSCRGSG